MKKKKKKQKEEEGEEENGSPAVAVLFISFRFPSSQRHRSKLWLIFLAKGMNYCNIEKETTELKKKKNRRTRGRGRKRIDRPQTLFSPFHLISSSYQPTHRTKLCIIVLAKGIDYLIVEKKRSRKEKKKEKKKKERGEVKTE